MLFRIPHIFHSVTPIRRFCIRSKVQPVSPQLNRLVEHFRRSPEVPSEGLSPRLTDFTNVRPVFPHSLLPSTGLTKRRLNHPEAIHLIPERRKTGKQGLAYNATCSFFAAYCCAVHPAVRSSSPDSAAGFPANRGAPPLWTSLCSGPPHPSLRSHARRSTEMPTCPLCARRPTLGVLPALQRRAPLSPNRRGLRANLGRDHLLRARAKAKRQCDFYRAKYKSNLSLCKQFA